MRGSRLAPRLLQLVANASGNTPSSSAGTQKWAAARLSAAAGAGAGGGSQAAAAPGSRRQWALALAACLGAGAAGAQLISSGSGSSTAECKAAQDPEAAGAAPKRKTRVVVLGTGWGAVSFLKNLDPKSFGDDGQYELVVVSPRSYFLYTPLLPSAAAGSVSERSIMEPIRNLLQGQGSFYQAECTSIDAERQVLTCAVDKCEVCKHEEQEPAAQVAAEGHAAARGWWPWARKGAVLSKAGPAAKPVGSSVERETFEVPYDILLVGVGSVNNTFGIKGVQEHCFFLKSIDDAHRLRVHVSKVIEHAGLPHLTQEQRCRHLNFVVVGGGPTGVELAAELHDFVKEDVARLMPHLKDDIKITVVDTMDHLLGAFDRQLSDYTASHFMREGIKVQLGTMVRAVHEGTLDVKVDGKEEVMPFGTCVWATGIAMNPLVRGLKEQLQRQLAEVQNARTGVVVDGHLRVKGTNGTIFALGDAAVTHQDKALENAASLFASADADGDQRLTADEVCSLLKKVQRQYPQMGELAAMLEEGVLEKAAKGMWGTSSKEGRYSKHVERLRSKEGLNYADFKELLADMDTLMRSLPPTAQVAAQEGKYLAKLFSQHTLAPVPTSAAPTTPAPANGGNGNGRERNIAMDVRVPLPADAPLFQYRHFGSFAYVGMDHAVLDLPSTFPFNTLKGWLVGLTWRGFETWGQMSVRNRLMVQMDWLRTKLWGRNITES